MTRSLAVVVACGLSLFAMSASAADLERGEELYEICAACHGPNGAGIRELQAPRFTGLAEWYLVRQIQNFKNGIRGADPRDEYGAQARAMIMTLPDGDAAADVAAYIATLESPPPEPTVTGDTARGQQLYAVCTACHGADGTGNEALNSPRLTGQSDWYLVRQLQNYKSGIRGTHERDIHGAQMRPMAMTLPDEQAIRDVVAYINTLD